MRSRPTPDQNLSNPIANAPSVPLSVYRELAAQLQAAEALSNALNAQNQQLLRQNHQLQQEFEKAVESALYWRQEMNAQKISNRPLTNVEVAHRRSLPKSPPGKTPIGSEGSLPWRTKQTAFRSPQIIEQEQGRYRRHLPKAVAEISGWSLAIAILLIMVTAFGAGYFMMRPLVQRR